MNLAKRKLVHKLTLVQKKSLSLNPKVLRKSAAKEGNRRILKSLLRFQAVVEQDLSPITINLFLEDLEVLSKLILKRHMRRDQQRNTGMKRLHSNKLQNTWETIYKSMTAYSLKRTFTRWFALLKQLEQRNWLPLHIFKRRSIFFRFSKKTMKSFDMLFLAILWFSTFGKKSLFWTHLK